MDTEKLNRAIGLVDHIEDLRDAVKRAQGDRKEAFQPDVVRCLSDEAVAAMVALAEADLRKKLAALEAEFADL